MKSPNLKTLAPLIAFAAMPLAAVPAQAQSIPFVPDIYMGLEAGTGERSASRRRSKSFGLPECALMLGRGMVTPRAR